MLRTTFHNTVVTPIPEDARPYTVTKLLNTHSFLITMSPIVTRHQECDRDPTSGKVTYDVWENIDLLPFGLWKHEIHFNCAFENKADGVTSWIQAPMGFQSRAVYTVRNDWDGEGGRDGGMVIEEAIESSCSMLFKPFVEWTMVPVRRKMHMQIINKAREIDRGVES